MLSDGTELIEDLVACSEDLIFLPTTQVALLCCHLNHTLLPAFCKGVSL